MLTYQTLLTLDNVYLARCEFEAKFNAKPFGFLMNYEDAEDFKTMCSKLSAPFTLLSHNDIRFVGLPIIRSYDIPKGTFYVI